MIDPPVRGAVVPDHVGVLCERAQAVAATRNAGADRGVSPAGVAGRHLRGNRQEIRLTSAKRAPVELLTTVRADCAMKEA